ncbi:MAG: hypothetical protein O3A63_14225 [Proteobacteria bacterium]|nr:hypothetical protein [Pseudomonadota bacterium]
MNAESYLSSVIEVAIGIAGFAGIVAAIRQRRLSTWPDEQRIMLQVLFFASAAAIFFGLFPAVLAEAGLTDAVIWTVCSCALIAWLILAIAFRAQQARAAGVRMTLPGLILVLAVGALGLQIYNITGPRVAWPYMAGVSALLVNGFTMFLLLLLRPVDDET